MAGSVEKRLEYHVVDQACDGGAVAIGSVFFFVGHYYTDVGAAVVKGKRASMAHPAVNRSAFLCHIDHENSNLVSMPLKFSTTPLFCAI